MNFECVVEGLYSRRHNTHGATHSNDVRSTNGKDRQAPHGLPVTIMVRNSGKSTFFFVGRGGTAETKLGVAPSKTMQTKN